MEQIPNQPSNSQKTVQIDLTGVEGVYSNLTLLAHSASEFIIDFARMEPGIPKAKIHSRVIMTPQNAKLLLRALESKIAAFEANFGTIQSPPRMGGDPNGDIGFKLP